MITKGDLAKLNKLIEQGKADSFYNWVVWKSKRLEVLKLDHYECQLCKAKGKYRKGFIVHHIKHLQDRPDLALSIYDGQERQLVTVCKQCHEEQHPESQRQFKPIEKQGKFNNIERWD